MFRLFVFLTLLAAGAAAQETVLLIRGARVVDGTGAPARVADTLVRGGRIEAIQPAIPPPGGARIVDAAGQTLIPGLFDLHTHLSAAAATGVAGDWGKNLKSYLACGVTTVNDFATYVEMYEPLRKILASGFPAPRVNMAVRFSTTGGHGTEGGWGDWMTFEANTPEQARARMKTALAYKPDVIKVFTDGWRYGTAANLTSMNVETLSAIVAEAHAAGIKVFTHTVTAGGAKIAAAAKVDGLVHGIGDAEVDQELIDLLKASGTAYAPTLAVYETHQLPVPARALQVMEPDVRAAFGPGPTPATPPARARRWQHLLASVRRLHAAGVPVASGTDAGMAGTFHGYATLHELELLVEAGLTPMQAIVAGTSASAKALGVESQRGTIAAGKVADLVLIDGQPDRTIADIGKTSRVFLNGVEVDLKALQADIQSGTPTPLPERALPAAIDDFERADGRTLLGTLRVNATDSGIDHSTMLWMPVARSGGSGHSMLVTARLAAKERPWVRLELPLTPGGVEFADASKFTGVTFDVRGEGSHRVLLMPGGKARSPFFAPVPAQGEWQTLKIPFAELQRAAREEGKWTGRNLRLLSFEVSGAPQSTAWLELDNIRFY